MKKSFFFFTFLIFLTNVLSVCNAQNNNSSIDLDSLLKEAINSTEKADFEKSLNLYNELLSVAEEEGSEKHLIKGNLNYGVLYYRINESEKALNYYFKALDLAKKYDKNEFLNSIYNNIGIIYSRNNEKTKALENFQAALVISKKRKDKRRIAINLINISNTYMELKRYEDSYKYLDDAKNIFTELKDYKSLSFVYNNLGSNDNDQKDYSSALVNFKKAIDFSDNTDRFYHSSYLLNLGRTYFYLNEYDSAITYLDSSLKLSVEVHHKENIINGYTLLAQTYQDYGYVNKALMNYNKSLAWKDSLLNERSQKWISEMQMKYEFGKKEKEVEFLEQKNKLNVFIWILSVSILLITGFLMFYSLRNRNIKVKQRNKILLQEKELAKLEQEKTEVENLYLHEEITSTEEISRINQEKLNQEIEHKNRELTSQALHVVNKNEILISINEKINTVNSENISDTDNKINEIKRLISSNVTLDGDWNAFKLHFEKVHHDFFIRLAGDFPELSQSDMRFCAYIIINLNSKEIAQIFNISPDSVRKRKQRLREKLNLSKDTDLHETLSQYK